MINKSHKKLSLTRQCELAGINKSSLYYERRAEPQANVELMNRMDVLHTMHPYYGSRRIQQVLQRDGEVYNLKRIRRLMYKMGIITQYPKRNLSKAAPRQKKISVLIKRHTCYPQQSSVEYRYYLRANGKRVYVFSGSNRLA